MQFCIDNGLLAVRGAIVLTGNECALEVWDEVSSGLAENLRVVGRTAAIATAVAGAAGLATIARRLVSRGGGESVEVFRVFGGDSRAQGYSWTTRDPRTVRNFRDGAGLPSGGASGSNNTADFLVRGRVNRSDIIESRPARPLDGNRGGLPELIIDSENVNLDYFEVLNP
jgi:hypothetical protein